MANDQPMWGNNQAVAPTPGAAIVAVDLGDNFTVKGHHLSMIKDRQFDRRSRANPHKHFSEFVEICGMFCYGNTNADAIKLKLFPSSLAGEAKISEENSPLLEKIEALTTRIDLQFKEIKGDMKEMRDGCNKCGGPHPSSNCDDKPMGGPKEEEENYASRGYRGNYYGQNSSNWRDRHENQNSNPGEENPPIPRLPEKKLDESEFEKTMREFVIAQKTANDFVKNQFYNLKTKVEQGQKNHQAAIQDIETKNMVKEMTTNFGKLDKFEGHDFRRWQKKMHFLLTTLKVVYVLTTPMPELLKDAIVEAIRIRESRRMMTTYAEELWDSLESKYMAKDSSSKKFLVSNFNNYKMVDSRPVMEQYNELLRIPGQYTQHGLKMDEPISVSSIIDKLPPSWKDFKHTLKHGKDDLSLVQLGSHLRIEESLRSQDIDKGKGKEVAGPSRSLYLAEKGAHTSRVSTLLLECWKCGKTGHFKRDCRSGNKKNANAGGSGKGSKDHSQDQVLEFSSGKSITLFNVLYVPKLRKNLISGLVLNKCGYKKVYESDKYILSKCGVFVGFGYYNNGMFMLNLNKVPDDSDSVYISYSSTAVNFSLWHARLAHVYYKRMLEMFKDELIPDIDENPDKYTTCMLTKITRKPFKSITKKSVILELIHSDLCNFHATPSLGNKKYVITFIDNASRFCYVYLLYTKDEALDKFRIYKIEVELQQNDLVKTLRTDRGGEYYDPVFFQSVGIIHETTAPYTPQQNGVAERKNRALKEMVNSMLSYSGLSEGFWGEAMLTACYLLNRVPNKRNKTTPYELWYKKRPNLAFLRVWGCRAVVRLPDPKRKTLGEKGIDCIFVGYAEHSKAYRFYVIEPNDSVSINSIIESRDAIFDENRFSLILRPNDIILKSDKSQRGDHSDDVPSEIHEPRKEAIDDEIGSIMENNTWVLSDLPPRCKPLDKWKDLITSITYAPQLLVSLTIDLLLALAAIHNLLIHQMDVKTAFLNGDLPLALRSVYEAKPEGFVMPCNEHKKILKKFNREDCSPVSTPMDPVEKLKPNTEDFDESWLSHVERFIFMSGMVFLLGGGAISWASNKQTCIIGSTMESEFVALVTCDAGAKNKKGHIVEHESFDASRSLTGLSICSLMD
ncbi:zinc finger, CCHC-type containing protein [Tanacetum coccineum]